jgi:hypothetical protein
VTDYRTPYDEALDAMLAAGIERGRADGLLMAVFEQGRLQKVLPSGCPKCSSTPLNHFLGHDHQGHKTANSLSAKGVVTPEALKAKGMEWVLDFTSVGARGIARIEERMDPDDYQAFAALRWSA